jgi:hypothetical protein
MVRCNRVGLRHRPLRRCKDPWVCSPAKTLDCSPPAPLASIGLSVSIWSWTLMKRTPRWSNSYSRPSRCRVM